MRTPSTYSSTPSRRVAAAALACGLVLGLASCSKEQTTDTAGSATDASGSAAAGAGQKDGAAQNAQGKSGASGSGAPAPGQTDANGSTVSEAPAAATDRPAGAPTQPIEQLVLGGGDAAEYQLVVTPSNQIGEQVKAMSGVAQGATYSPPECSDADSSAAAAQQQPGTTAISTGQAGGQPVAVAISTVTSDLAKQADLVKRCPQVDITFPVQGGELKNHVTRTAFDAPAPAGVEQYSGIVQKSVATAGGQSLTSTVISMNGKVRGIAVNAVTQNPSGDVSPEARKAVVDLFTKQVEKIKRS